VTIRDNSLLNDCYYYTFFARMHTMDVLWVYRVSQPVCLSTFHLRNYGTNFN